MVNGTGNHLAPGGRDKREGECTGSKPASVGLARSLRVHQTEAETLIWAKLREAWPSEFRRQEPIGSYIVDFVSYEHKIIIEVDGGQHNEPGHIAQDEKRATWLESQGYRVL